MQLDPLQVSSASVRVTENLHNMVSNRTGATGTMLPETLNIVLSFLDRASLYSVTRCDEYHRRKAVAEMARREVIPITNLIKGLSERLTKSAEEKPDLREILSKIEQDLEEVRKGIDFNNLRSLNKIKISLLEIRKKIIKSLLSLNTVQWFELLKTLKDCHDQYFDESKSKQIITEIREILLFTTLLNSAKTNVWLIPDLQKTSLSSQQFVIRFLPTLELLTAEQAHIFKLKIAGNFLDSNPEVSAKAIEDLPSCRFLDHLRGKIAINLKRKEQWKIAIEFLDNNPETSAIAIKDIPPSKSADELRGKIAINLARKGLLDKARDVALMVSKDDHRVDLLHEIHRLTQPRIIPSVVASPAKSNCNIM